MINGLKRPWRTEKKKDTFRQMLALSYWPLAMRDYTKYDIWNEGIILSVMIYEITSSFPEEEKYGLISQIRRASVSISSNFAEGCSRSSEKDFKRFIEISLGSAFELKTQLIISTKLGFARSEKVEELIEIVDKLSKQLNSLRNKLK